MIIDPMTGTAQPLPYDHDVSEAAPQSLRERKKARTRAQLITCSRELFGTQGYADTTLEQIAAAAEVSVPTVLAYFDSKERLALALDYELQERFHHEVTDPSRTERTVDLWRRYVVEGAELMMAQNPATVVEASRQRATPVLAQAHLVLMGQYQESLRIGLSADAGTVMTDDLESRVLATTLAYGANDALRGWLDAGATGDLVAEALEIVDLACAKFGQPTAAKPKRRARR